MANWTAGKIFSSGLDFCEKIVKGKKTDYNFSQD